MPDKIPTARNRFQATKIEARRAYDRQPDRRAAWAFYNSAAWKRLRAAILADSPLCNRCPPERKLAAVDVHHKTPRDVAPDLALDPDNLEALCKTCHKSTRSEDKAHRSRRPSS